MIKNKKNLLIIGASGIMGHSTLIYLKNHREKFNRLVLVDQAKFTEDKFINLDELNAEFVKFTIDTGNKKSFLDLISRVAPDIILDLSNAPTDFISSVVFEYGKASYICCAFCTEKSMPLGDALNDFIDNTLKKTKTTMPHIFFTGMNPGAVNIWAAIGVNKFGIPSQITEMEIDTSQFRNNKNAKLVTWCPPAFIVEIVSDPSEIVLGDHKIKNLYPNSLYHLEDLKPLFRPILKLDSYPKGMVVSHEECVTLGNRWDIPIKFLYTINPATVKYIKRLHEKKGTVEEGDLVVGKNFDEPLIGSDNIAMRLDYPDKAVYYFNSESNENFRECSGTAYQVTTGIFAALFTLINNNLKKRIYFTEDLLDTFFTKFITDNMLIEEIIFKKDKKGKLRLVSHDPHVSYGSGPFIRL